MYTTIPCSTARTSIYTTTLSIRMVSFLFSLPTQHLLLLHLHLHLYLHLVMSQSSSLPYIYTPIQIQRARDNWFFWSLDGHRDENRKILCVEIAWHQFHARHFFFVPRDEPSLRASRASFSIPRARRAAAWR